MNQNAAARARTILQGSPLFFDTETTGLGSNAEIVEVGVVDAVGKTVLESLVRPRRRIPSDAIAVHGISNEMVRDAPTWAEVCRRFDNCSLVGASASSTPTLTCA